MGKFPKSLVYAVTNLDGTVTTYMYEWTARGAVLSANFYRRLILNGEIANVKAELVW
jgi:hypothetical protein